MHLVIRDAPIRHGLQHIVLLYKLKFDLLKQLIYVVNVVIFNNLYLSHLSTLLLFNPHCVKLFTIFVVLHMCISGP